jgi:antitoxin component YwqK of YwqJK toxin-antitoxin module
MEDTTKADHEGEYKDGKKVGLWKYYYENGQLGKEEEYKDGKKVGLHKTYYKNGQLSCEIEHKDDKAKHKKYHENGQLKEEKKYKNGKLAGLLKIYHENGKLKVEASFTNGVQDNGDVISYHDNGIKARISTMENHLKNGPYYEWYRNGQLKTEGIYNDQVPTVLKEWDENGVLIIAEWTNSEKEEYLNQSSKVNIKLLYDLREEYFQLYDNENYPEAIKRLTQIIEKIPLLKSQSFIAYTNPNDMLNGILLDEIYFNRSQLYLKLNLIEEAKNDLIKAIKSNPKRKEALYHHHLGCTIIECGDFTSCIEHFNIALEIDPENYNSYYMRAVAYCSDKSGLTDVNQAIDDLKKYLEYEPDDVAALNLLNVLQKNIEESPQW